MSEGHLKAALEAIRNGHFVIVVDDDKRENEGDLILAAEKATPEKIAFMVRHTSGIICVPLPQNRLEALKLPQMVQNNTDPKQTAFSISVDYQFGTTTGVSSSDRAKTIQALVDPEAMPKHFQRPGHVFPLKAIEGGVLKRQGHTEAALDLCRLAGLREGGVLAELVNDDGSVSKSDQLKAFAKQFEIPILSISDLIEHRLLHENLVLPLAKAKLPSKRGSFEVRAFRSLIDGVEHLALLKGPVDGAQNLLVRIHSECITGDVFDSSRCDCGSQLQRAMQAIEQEGSGLLIYLRGHEGRGIGIASKIEAYHLQDGGLDTVEANLHLGLPIDGRDFAIAAQILRSLGVKSMRLMTNNPLKVERLRHYQMEVVERVPLLPALTDDNAGYLRTKREKLGHLLDPIFGL